MKKFVLICQLLFVSNVAYSYGLFNGTVKDVRIDRSGLGIIAFDGPVINDPAPCRSSYYASHMSFNANTDGGKAIYSMDLTAVATGKQVAVIGTNSCDEYGNTVESLSYWHFLK